MGCRKSTMVTCNEWFITHVLLYELVVRWPGKVYWGATLSLTWGSCVGKWYYSTRTLTCFIQWSSDACHQLTYNQHTERLKLFGLFYFLVFARWLFGIWTWISLLMCLIIFARWRGLKVFLTRAALSRSQVSAKRQYSASWRKLIQLLQNAEYGKVWFLHQTPGKCIILCIGWSGTFTIGNSDYVCEWKWPQRQCPSQILAPFKVCWGQLA